MSETMDTNFDDFFGAFDDGDGYQTDTAEDAAEEAVEDTAEMSEDEQDAEAAEGSESAETNEEENTSEAEEDGGEKPDEAEKPVSEQKFVVKVNKETREVSYQDAPAWIQKGMDYDRVKGQLENEQKNGQALQTRLDEQQEIMDILNGAAENSKMTIPELLDHVQLGILMSQGFSEKEARAELRALKAESKVKSITEKNVPAKEEPAAEADETRAQREVADFMRDFPGVTLTDEQIEKMRPDIQNGMSMTAAYLKMENNRLKAEAEAQKQKEAAAAQSKKNRAKAPGSLRDSGGQKTKTAEDDFFAAFEK